MRLTARGAGIAARMLLALISAAFVGSTGQVRAAADVVFTDLDGKVHRIDDYRGKWVIVNYWATWCPPCLEEIPELVQFHEEHKDTDAVVLGVNSEDITPERLREFVDSFLVTYPVIPVEPSASSPFGPLPGLPITFLVSPEGEVVARQIGGVTREAIERFMERWNMENL